VVAAGAVLVAAFGSPARAVTIERVVSPGGIEAWLVAEPSIPAIALRLAFRGGAGMDPGGKAGLADMVSGLLDEGAGELDSKAFQQRLNDLAITLAFEAGRDHFDATLRTLSENRDAAFGLLKLALTEPRFDAEPVERIRSQLLVGLARSAEDPNAIAARSWFAAVFPDHPYGRPVRGTMESIKVITVDDLRVFVRDRLARDNLVIGVAGDITAEVLAPLLDETFGGLPESAVPEAVPEVRPSAAGETMVVERDIPQSVVVFGHEGLKRDDPDYYAAYVMNYILGGGGFSSRLTREVRERRGLAYSVHSYLRPMDHVGLVVGGVATENERLAESLAVIRDEWRRLRAGGVTDEEISHAKRYLTGSFPLRLDNRRKIAGILVAIQLDELGIDFLERRNGLIEAVSAEDIGRVVERLIRPETLTVVVVGKPEGVDPTREAPAGLW
jgi:zinc protease